MRFLHAGGLGKRQAATPTSADRNSVDEVIAEIHTSLPASPWTPAGQQAMPLTPQSTFQPDGTPRRKLARLDPCIDTTGHHTYSRCDDGPGSLLINNGSPLSCGSAFILHSDMFQDRGLEQQSMLGQLPQGWSPTMQTPPHSHTLQQGTFSTLDGKALSLHSLSNQQDNVSPALSTQQQAVGKRSNASAAPRNQRSSQQLRVQGTSSSLRGVTRHRWTGRYEAHLWDSSVERKVRVRTKKAVSGLRLVPLALAPICHAVFLSVSCKSWSYQTSRQ